MDDRTFYDMMSAYADPYHVASTVGGAMVREGLRSQSYPSPWPTASRRQQMVAADTRPYSAEPIGSVTQQAPVASASRAAPGFMDQSADATARLTMWFIRWLWPLNALERLGRRITRVTWKGKLPLTIVAAIAAPAAIGSGGTLVLLAGAAAGWFLLPIVGTLIALVAVLTGLALAMATVGVGLTVIYRVLRALLA